MKFVTVPVVIVAVILGVLFAKNPLLFGRRTGESNEGFSIYTHNPDLDEELFTFAPKIGHDFAAYRNHCLRVLTFTKYFLPDSVLKDIPNAFELAATALAYHDVALWTDKRLDYLEPAVKQLQKGVGERFSAKEMTIMKDMILQHHKVTDYTSGLGDSADVLINAVRKADWADATYGIVRFGLPVSLLEAAYDKIPESGFHKLLLGLGEKLSPGDIKGQLELLKILKW